MPRYEITYARDIVDSVEARDLDHAGRLACAAVFACDPAMHARVLSVIRTDPPADMSASCPDCKAVSKAPQLTLPPPTTPSAA
jgi:hypothetical protein